MSKYQESNPKAVFGWLLFSLAILGLLVLPWTMLAWPIGGKIGFDCVSLVFAAIVLAISTDWN